MVEIVLSATIVAVLGLLAYEKRENRRQIDKLTNALISKNAKELRDLDLSDKVVVNEPSQSTEPDLVPLSQLNDKEFDKLHGIN